MAGQTHLDIRQSETRILQDQLNATAVNPMDSTLASINNELTAPGRLIAQATPSLAITINGSDIVNPNTGKNRILFPISNTVVSFVGGTITFPSTSGTITVSPGINGSITIGASQFCAVLVQLSSTGQLNVVVGAAASSLSAVVVPGGITANLSLGFVIVSTNASSVIQSITNGMLYQFSGGGQSGNAGVSIVGALDSEVTPSVNGATISGSNLILQSAGSAAPGLVNTIAQQFAGNKEFLNNVAVDGVLSGPTITALHNNFTAGFQNFVDTTTNIVTATATTGTPAAGTFYSSIVNRASMPDPSQNLKAIMGVDRMIVNQIARLQGEFGPANQPVFSSTNDTFGRIRFVGAGWSTLQSNSLGPVIQNLGLTGDTATTNFLEITFYGTGLNLLTILNSSSISGKFSVDGGALTLISSISTIGGSTIVGRNYNPYQVANIVSGLTLGVHTVTITNNAPSVQMYVGGFEILNESSSVIVNKGSSYTGGSQYVSTSPSTFSYSSVVTGTRGGRVLVYQNPDGSIGKAFTPTNATSLFGTSAVHTNEQIARTYGFREFSAGLAGDFSSPYVSGSAGNAIFTLDDGSTSLYGFNIYFGTANNVESPFAVIGTSAITFTFTGTGLDVFVSAIASPGTISFSVDSGGGGTITPTAQTNSLYKIASGLPYGTHQVYFTSATANKTLPYKFIVYQPALPSLPSGSVALADYNVLANFSANTTADFRAISAGTMRKSAYREFYYTPSWTVTAPASLDNTVIGTQAISGVSGGGNNSVFYTFFGTGFDIRFDQNGGSSSDTWLLQLDGSTNFSGFTTNLYTGTGNASFTPATGNFVPYTGGGTSKSNGLTVSGIPLGLHQVVLAKNLGTGAGIGFECIDIITPIHSYKNSGPATQSGVLSVGSNSIADERLFTPVKNTASVKSRSQALGVTANPSTTSTVLVPLPDMFTTISTDNGLMKVSYNVSVSAAAVSQQVAIVAFVDGVQVGTEKLYTQATNATGEMSDVIIVPVGAGVHTVMLFWSVSSGTASGVNVYRSLVVEEL